MLSSLETLVVLYETRSFTKTAEQLYITQPTVTTRIQKLEYDLSVQLFIRTDLRTIIPTQECEQLYLRAKSMLQYWDEARSEVDSPKKEKLPFTLAFSHNASSLFFEPIFKMVKKYIDVLDVACHIYDSQTIVEKVECGKIDFAIIERPLTSIHMESFVFAEDDLVWAGIDKSDTFIALETQGKPGEYIRHFLKQNMCNIKNIVNMTDSKLIIEAVNSGLGSTLTSNLLISKDIPYKNLGPDYHRKFFGIYFKYNQNPLILEVINDIKQYSNLTKNK